MKRRGVIILSALWITGCASTQTKTFRNVDAAVTNQCLAVESSAPIDRRIALSGGRYLSYEAALCYQRNIKAATVNYHNADVVYRFADFVVDLTRARANGSIDAETAARHFSNTVMLYNQAIATRDSASDRETAAAIAGIAAAGAAMYSESRERAAANRPVVCNTVRGVGGSVQTICN